MSSTDNTSADSNNDFGDPNNHSVEAEIVAEKEVVETAAEAKARVKAEAAAAKAAAKAEAEAVKAAAKAEAEAAKAAARAAKMAGVKAKCIRKRQWNGRFIRPGDGEVFDFPNGIPEGYEEYFEPI